MHVGVQISSFCKDISHICWGFLGGSMVKEPTCQCRRHRRLGFDTWVKKTPRGSNGNVLHFLAWRAHRQRSLVGYHSSGCKESDRTEWLSTHTVIYIRWDSSTLPGGSDGEEFSCNAGDLDSIPGLGRSPVEGHGNPLQYSCLENPMGRGAWWATAHGVTRSQTRLSDWAEHSTHPPYSSVTSS